MEPGTPMCLCSKLRAAQYDQLDSHEVGPSSPFQDAPDLFHPVPSRPATPSSKLVNTYKANTRTTTLRLIAQLDVPSHPGQHLGSPSVRIYSVIQTADKLKRIGAYAFATLHDKSTSIDHVFSEISHAFPGTTKKMVYRILHAGACWMDIVKQLADIAQEPPRKVLGVLCVFTSVTSWERAKPGERHVALDQLVQTTDLVEYVRLATPVVASVLDRLLGASAFVHEWIPASRPVRPALQTPRRSALPVQHRQVCEAVPSADGRGPPVSSDALLLFSLLSNLDPSSPFPVSLLERGAAPARRWTAQGLVEVAEACPSGLAPELAALFADHTRLTLALQELGTRASVVSAVDNHDGAYRVDETAAGRFVHSLPPEERAFWQQQALLVVYRAIPWKYLDMACPDSVTILPHLRHTLQAVSQTGFSHVPASVCADLTLTLVEAARFPRLSWKRYVLAKAEEVSAEPATDDEEPAQLTHVRAAIYQSHCVLARISGDVARATSYLDLDSTSTRQHLPKTDTPTDARVHAAAGFSLVQRALNHIQAEQMDAAEGCLASWRPVDGGNPSLLEQVVLFRHDMIRGRLLRFRGQFAASQTCLESALRYRHRAGDHLVFDEELRDVACDLADALREQHRLDSAQTVLEAERQRQRLAPGVAPRTDAHFVHLALAEVSFARSDLAGAEALCAGVLASPPPILRFCRLRAHTILAKTHQARGAHQRALDHWTEALKAISQFTLTNGHTTQVMLASARECVRHMTAAGRLVSESDQQLRALAQASRPGGTRYWMAGMEDWYQTMKLDAES